MKQIRRSLDTVVRNVTEKAGMPLLGSVLTTTIKPKYIAPIIGASVPTATLYGILSMPPNEMSSLGTLGAAVGIGLGYDACALLWKFFTPFDAEPLYVPSTFVLATAGYIAFEILEREKENKQKSRSAL